MNAEYAMTSSAPGQVGPGAAQRAFTLIEVLLAVAIFSIVLVAIHMVFYGAVQLRNKTTEAIEQQIPLQQALTIIKRDLANVVMPGGTFFGDLQTSASTSTTATNLLNSMSPVPDAVPGQSGPAFFTASAVVQDSLPWGDVQRVSYYLAPSTNNTPGKVLIRSITHNLLPPTSQQPELQPLLNGLQSMTFSFYDGTQWRDYWDSTIETNKLPQGFRVQLQLLPDPRERVQRPPIELVVPVMLQAPTNQTSQTSGGAQ